MSNLISREVAIKVINDNVSTIAEKTFYDCLLYRIPAVDAVPVVHGEWIISDFSYNGDKYWRFNCSECGATNTCRHEDSKFDYWANRNFCPNCGAKMDGNKTQILR